MKNSVLETIGSPLVRIDSPPGTEIAAKLDARNPGGSAKDRPALFMVEAAERDGRLEPGGHIVEPTSGNTGVGLAVVAAVKGYDLTIVMPEEKSVERRNLMKAYGANIELTPGSDISTAKDRADELEAERGMVQLRQFENPANPASHQQTTATEILEAVGDRRIDAFVAGVGTGGTIMGTSRGLREVFPDIRIVAVEPEGNAPIATGKGGVDDFQGMGPGFVSEIVDTALIDSVEIVSLDVAEEECRRLAREEGILAGQSSGASAIAAKRVANRLADEPPSDSGDQPLVVTMFWDSGERYMSTGMFDD